MTSSSTITQELSHCNKFCHIYYSLYRSLKDGLFSYITYLMQLSYLGNIFLRQCIVHQGLQCFDAVGWRWEGPTPCKNYCHNSVPCSPWEHVVSLSYESCSLEARGHGCPYNHYSFPDLSWQHGGTNTVILQCLSAVAVECASGKASGL